MSMNLEIRQATPFPEVLAIPMTQVARTRTTPFAGTFVLSNDVNPVSGFRPDLKSVYPLIVVRQGSCTRRLIDCQFFVISNSWALISNNPNFRRFYPNRMVPDRSTLILKVAYRHCQ